MTTIRELENYINLKVIGLEDSGEFDGATWYALNFWLPLEKSIA